MTEKRSGDDRKRNRSDKGHMNGRGEHVSDIRLCHSEGWE